MGLRGIFQQANDMQLLYVILNDDHCLPDYVPAGETEIRILVESAHRARLIGVMNLTPQAPTLKERNELFTSPDIPVTIRLIPKGKGYFPEDFESKLLAQRHFVNICVPVVALEDMLWVAMYEHLYHKLEISDRMRLTFLRAVNGRIGRSIYRNPHKPKKPQATPVQENFIRHASHQDAAGGLKANVGTK